MSAIDKQEKLTFEGSRSSEMLPAMTRFPTFCLCLITEALRIGATCGKLEGNQEIAKLKPIYHSYQPSSGIG